LYRLAVQRGQHREAVIANVAKILRKERIARGLSMTLVAERAGLSQQMVSYVERGLRNPTLDTLLRITEVLEIDITSVLSRATKASHGVIG